MDATQDTSIVTVDNSGDADVDNQLAKYPVSTLCNSFVPTCHDRDRPGFFAVIYYDGTDFQIFTRAAHTHRLRLREIAVREPRGEARLRRGQLERRRQQRLIEGGAPGLHFYTLNLAKPTTSVLKLLQG